MPNTEKHQKGFTLIEIAIVLVIVGLLIGMGASLMGPLTQRVKNNETKEIVNAAVESLQSYGASNNELPDTASFPTVVRKPDDVWGKSLYYLLDDNLTDSTIGGICGRKSTDLTINICSDAGCSSPAAISNVAFIVLSSGGNFNNQTAGTQSVISSTTINLYDIGVSMDNYTTDMNRVEANDDIARWITIDELRAKAGCVGAQLRIINNELPYGFQGSTYSASMFADGGVPFADGAGDTDTEVDYEWCWQEDPINNSPSGINFSCDGAIAFSATCNLITGTWEQCTSLIISGAASATGSYKLTFFARDENDSSGTDDNIAQKAFVLTINPTATAGGCSDYRVWNNTSGPNRDFNIDSNCITISNGSEITTTYLLNSGETMTRHTTSNGSCGGSLTSLIYNSAVTADSDGDCCVYFDATDRTCP